MPQNEGRMQKRRAASHFALSRVIPIALIVAMLFSVIPTGFAITAADIEKLKDEREAIAAQKVEVEAKLADVQDDMDDAVARKMLLEEQIEIIRGQLAITNNMILYYDGEIALKTEELAAAEAEEAKYYQLFCDRVRAMEEGEQASYWSILFESDDFEELLDRMNQISEIMTYDNYVMEELEKARLAVAAAKADLELLREEQAAEKVILEATEAELFTQQQQVDALVKEIEAQQERYKNELGELSVDEHDLSDDIAAAEKQYQEQLAAQAAAQNSGGGGGSSGGTATLTGNGGFVWPTPGHYRVTSDYGPRIHPISGSSSFHGGTDIGAPGGANIQAMKAGTVVIATYNSSYGNYVVISHYDGSKTLYAHMRSMAVSAGQSVNQGQVIGYVGTTGSSTGNHLHFEVWKGSSSSTRTDPMQFFG